MYICSTSRVKNKYRTLLEANAHFTHSSAIVDLVQDGDQWRALVNVIMNLQVP
jgi:hypothetical protein